MNAKFPHIAADRVPDDWRIEHVGTQCGMAAIWWKTAEGTKMTFGMITGYPKKWRELLLREGKSEEQADAIISGPVRFKA